MDKFSSDIDGYVLYILKSRDVSKGKICLPWVKPVKQNHPSTKYGSFG